MRFTTSHGNGAHQNLVTRLPHAIAKMTLRKQAVVDHVCKLRDSPRINLRGWSLGTQYAGLFVMTHAEIVARYVSYAQMHANSADLAIRRERPEIFRQTLT